MRARCKKNAVPVRLREAYQEANGRSEYLEKFRSRKLHKSKSLVKRSEKRIEKEIQEIFRRAQRLDLNDTGEIELHLNPGIYNSLKRKASFGGRSFKP